MRPTPARFLLRRSMLLAAVSLSAALAVRCTAPATEAAPAASTTTVTSTTTTAPSTTTTVLVPQSTTPDPTTTTTLLPGDWACPEAITLAAAVGWPSDELDTLDAVIWRESRCDASARSTTHDTGLTQINDFWLRPTAAFPAGFLQTAGVADEFSDLYDAETSLRASLVIFTRSGWAPWGGRP